MKTMDDADKVIEQAFDKAVKARRTADHPISGYYSSARAKAQTIREAIRNGEWEPDALSFLKKRLEAAEYVGD